MKLKQVKFAEILERRVIKCEIGFVEKVMGFFYKEKRGRVFSLL